MDFESENQSGCDMRDLRAGQEGSALLAVMVFVLLLAGSVMPVLFRGLREQQASSAGLLRARLLAVAESGLNLNYVRLDADTLYAFYDADFTWDAATREFRSTKMTLGIGGASQLNSFRFSVQYLQAGVAVDFGPWLPVAGEVVPRPDVDFNTIKVTCSAGTLATARIVTAWYRFSLDKAMDGAVISDRMVLDPLSANGKGTARSGHLVFEGHGRLKQHSVFGEIKSNGKVLYYGSGPVELDDANVLTYLKAFGGTIEQDLGGTADEIPDFTSLGGPHQLFDFGRFEAAAAAGAGRVYTSLVQFNAAVGDANAFGDKLEGIQFVKIDLVADGPNPGLNINLGINMTGTLVFYCPPGTPPDYKIVIQSPVRVNAADLTNLDVLVESTYASGYPGTFEIPTTKHPWEVDIEILGLGYANFTVEDDLPAVMFNNGIVDFHRHTNICGAVYGPSFIEIENKTGVLQYFNGAIFGGGGIYFEAHASGQGDIAVRHDKNTTDRLAVMGNKGQGLVRTGYAIVK